MRKKYGIVGFFSNATLAGLVMCAPLTVKTIDTNVPEGRYAISLEVFRNHTEEIDDRSLNNQFIRLSRILQYKNIKASQNIINELRMISIPCFHQGDQVSCRGEFNSIEELYSSRPGPRRLVRFEWYVLVGWDDRNPSTTLAVRGRQTKMEIFSR